MPKQTAPLLAFNRGIVGQQALARVDLERMRLSAEQQRNWVARSVGSMMLRPGTAYFGTTLNNSRAVHIPFIFSSTDTAIIECTDSIMRPLVSGVPIERNSVSTAITNGDFGAGAGWTITGVGGASGSIVSGALTLSCVPIDSYATATQTVSVALADRNVEHGLRIVVERGPVLFKIGSASGAEDIFNQTVLDTGTHSLSFIPTVASIYIEFEARTARTIYVNACEIEAAGEVQIPAFWGEDDLDNLRHTSSGNVVFLACYGHAPYKIERRYPSSWSLVKYMSYDGPFTGATSDSLVKLKSSQPLGATTITASRPFFKGSHVGQKFRIFSPGYDHAFTLGQEDCYCPPVRVSGVQSNRDVSLDVSGTWVGTITIQKSFTDATTGFTDVSSPAPTTVNGNFAITDTADNTIMWVRVGFKAGEYTSGQAIVRLTHGVGSATSGTVSSSSGGRYGICEITSITSTTSAEAVIYSYFSSGQYSNIWYEGEWSDTLGWPSAVAFQEGRLFWAGRDKIWGSISDSYYSFNPSQEGDSGPLQRSIGYGPVDRINFLMPLQRVVIGSEGSEVQIKSSAFDEPLTPTNFTLKDFSTFGSARLPGVKVDSRGFFAKKGGARLMEVSYSVEAQDYKTTDATKLAPDFFLDATIVKIVVQRQPDTRIHCLRSDGTVGIYVFEAEDDVRCLLEYETDGEVEDAVILPGTGEDQVWYIVKRTIGGSTVRYRERWAQEIECVGAAQNKLADSHVSYSGASTATATGLGHLEGETVIIWGNSKDLGTETVSGGQVPLPEYCTDYVIGLGYDATFKSTKLAYAAAGGSALNQKKRVDHIGLILYQTHYQGLEFGRDFTTMDNLPLVKDGVITAPDTIYETYDHDMSVFNGRWDTDSRLCLRATAPRPCTVLAATLSITTSG